MHKQDSGEKSKRGGPDVGAALGAGAGSGSEVQERGGTDLYENGRNGEQEGAGPDEGQNDLGLFDGAHGLGLHRVDNGVAPVQDVFGIKFCCGI